MNLSKSNQSPSDTSGIFYGYIIVVASLLIMLIMFGTRYAFGVFLKPVLTEFGWSRAMITGAFSLSMFMEGLLGIVMGGLNDRFGPRKVLTFCGLFFGAGCLLMAKINSVWQLYLFYGIIMGIGMSGVWVPLLSTVARWFVKRRGMMSGIVLTGTGLGALIAPPAANWLISRYDWRTSYIIIGIIILVVVIICAQFLRRDPSLMGQVPDGVNREGEHDLNSVNEGLTFREAVHTKQFFILLVMLFCLGVCMFTVMVHIVPHATDLGIPPASAAKILSVLGGLAVLGRLILGSAADKMGPRQIFIIGFILLSVALFSLIPVTGLWMLYLLIAVFGFGQGGMGASESPLIASVFGLRSHGVIFGVLGFFLTIGAAIGPFMAGYIFDNAGSYNLAFAFCAVAGIIGLVCTFLLTPIKGR